MARRDGEAAQGACNNCGGGRRDRDRDRPVSVALGRHGRNARAPRKQHGLERLDYTPSALACDQVAETRATSVPAAATPSEVRAQGFPARAAMAHRNGRRPDCHPSALQPSPRCPSLRAPSPRTLSAACPPKPSRTPPSPSRRPRWAGPACRPSPPPRRWRSCWPPPRCRWRPPRAASACARIFRRRSCRSTTSPPRSCRWRSCRPALTGTTSTAAPCGWVLPPGGCCSWGSAGRSPGCARAARPACAALPCPPRRIHRRCRLAALWWLAPAGPILEPAHPPVLRLLLAARLDVHDPGKGGELFWGIGFVAPLCMWREAPPHIRAAPGPTRARAGHPLPSLPCRPDAPPPTRTRPSHPRLPACRTA